MIMIMMITTTLMIIKWKFLKLNTQQNRALLFEHLGMLLIRNFTLDFVISLTKYEVCGTWLEAVKCTHL